MQEPSTFSCTMPDDLGALAGMRRELRAWLSDRGVEPETAEDVVLAAWEVCANAIEHPVDRLYHEVTLVATADPSGVRVVVEDSGAWREHIVPRPERGLGLRIANAMVDRMAIVCRPPGTEVVLWRSTGRHG